MDQQQAGITMTVFSSRAFRTNRMAMAAPQPGQATCPEYMYSRSTTSSSIAHLAESHPDGLTSRVGGRAVEIVPGAAVDFPDNVLRNVPPAQTRNKAQNHRPPRQAVEGGPEFLRKYSGCPERKVAVDDRDLAHGSEHLPHQGRREGPEELYLEEPDFLSLRAQLFYNLSRRAGDRARGCQHDIGVLAANGFNSSVPAAEKLIELRIELFEPAERLFHGLLNAVAHLHVDVLRGHLAEGARGRRAQRDPWPE